MDGIRNWCFWDNVISVSILYLKRWKTISAADTYQPEIFSKIKNVYFSNHCSVSVCSDVYWLVCTWFWQHWSLTLLSGLIAGLFCVEDPRVYLSMAIAYITTMQGPICLGSCKHLSSLGIWLASAMDSSSCLVLLASVHHYCLFAIYTDLLSASSWNVLNQLGSVFCFLFLSSVGKGERSQHLLLE